VPRLISSKSRISIWLWVLAMEKSGSMISNIGLWHGSKIRISVVLLALVLLKTMSILISTIYKEVAIIYDYVAENRDDDKEDKDN